jgi:two-component system sensor histidine kinase/response regulator
MPVIDGWALADAIQAEPVLAGTRLIVLTSVGQSFSSEELQKAGIEAYLMKPVNQSRLFDCMANALDKAMVEALLTDRLETLRHRRSE